MNNHKRDRTSTENRKGSFSQVNFESTRMEKIDLSNRFNSLFAEDDVQNGSNDKEIDNFDPVIINPFKLDTSQIKLEIDKELIKKQQLIEKKNYIAKKHKTNINEPIGAILKRIKESQERINELFNALEIKKENEKDIDRNKNEIFKECVASSYGEFIERKNLFDILEQEDLDKFLQPHSVNSYQGHLYTRLIPVQIVREFNVNVICVIDTNKGNFWVTKFSRNGSKKEQVIVRCIADFKELQRQLFILYPNSTVTFPVMTNIDPHQFEIMMQKRTELQHFFENIISQPYISSSLPFERFFDPFDDEMLTRDVLVYNIPEKEGKLVLSVNEEKKEEYWCIIQNYLYYFPLDKKQLKPIGKIALDYCSIEVSSRENFSICITDIFSKNTWTLYSENETDQINWIKALRSTKTAQNSVLTGKVEEEELRLGYLTIPKNFKKIKKKRKYCTSKCKNNRHVHEIQKFFTINEKVEEPDSQNNIIYQVVKIKTKKEIKTQKEKNMKKVLKIMGVEEENLATDFSSPREAKGIRSKTRNGTMNFSRDTEYKRTFTTENLNIPYNTKKASVGDLGLIRTTSSIINNKPSKNSKNDKNKDLVEQKLEGLNELLQLSPNSKFFIQLVNPTGLSRSPNEFKVIANYDPTLSPNGVNTSPNGKIENNKDKNTKEKDIKGDKSDKEDSGSVSSSPSSPSSLNTQMSVLDEPKTKSLTRKTFGELNNTYFTLRSKNFSKVQKISVQKQYIIMYATLQKLISKICSPETPKSLVEDVLLTHTCLVSSRDLISYLVSKYVSYVSVQNVQQNSLDYSIPYRICYIFKKWLKIGPEVFQKDCKLTQILIHLVDNYFLKQPHLSKNARKIKHILEITVLNKQRKSLPIQITTEKLNPPFLPSLFSGSNFTFLDLDPLEVSKQLCLLEHSIYCDIEPSEMTKCQWSKPQKMVNAPNITKLIQRFNQSSKWVSTLIIETQQLEPRAFILSRFIILAFYSFRMRNFNFTAAVISALNGVPVKRLQRTWEKIPHMHTQLFQKLSALLDRSKNFTIYRTLLFEKKSSLPTLPYIGTFLTDLTFLSENKNKHPGMVDVQNCRKIAKVISNLIKLKEIKYEFVPVPSIQNFLSSVCFLSDEDLYKKSCYIENFLN